MGMDCFEGLLVWNQEVCARGARATAGETRFPIMTRGVLCVPSRYFSDLDP